MQVWSQRKHIEGAERAPARQIDGSIAEVWALRVLVGVHAGAERKLAERDMLIIGSADDCDLIFSDSGVAAHHCIVNYADGQLTVRAVDAEVRIDDNMLHPGDPVAVAPFALIRAGGARFAMGPHWSERWQTLLARVEQRPVASEDSAVAPETKRHNGKFATLAVALVLLCAGGAALTLAQKNTKPVPAIAPVVPRDSEVRALVHELGFNGLGVEQRGEQSVVTGYVERTEDMAVVRSRLDQRGFSNTIIEAKSGPRIASDVGESLRMNNLHVDTKWNGAGHVEVKGRFGDEKALYAVLGSRTIKEVNEKLHLKVDVVNLDPPPSTAKAVTDGKRIRRIVDGDDPYLLTVDNTKYYLHSTLPQGGTFLGIEEGDVLVRDDAGNVQRLPRDSVVDAQSP